GAAGPGRLRPTAHRLPAGPRVTPSLAPQAGTRHDLQPLPDPAGIPPTPRTAGFPRQLAEIQPARPRAPQGLKEQAEGPLPTSPQDRQNGHRPLTATLNRKVRLPTAWTRSTRPRGFARTWS